MILVWILVSSSLSSIIYLPCFEEARESIALWRVWADVPEEMKKRSMANFEVQQIKRDPS